MADKTSLRGEILEILRGKKSSLYLPGKHDKLLDILHLKRKSDSQSAGKEYTY